MTFVDGGDVWLLGSGFLTDCFLTGGSWFLSSVFVVASGSVCSALPLQL